MYIKDKNLIYAELIESMNQSVCMADKNEVIIYANPNFCNLIKYSLDEIIWKSFFLFLDENSIKKVKEVNLNERKKWITSSYEANLITKTWKNIPILINWVPTPNGWTIGTITDLREIKEKEKNEKILLNAVKYSTDAIILFNPNLEITSWNNWAEILFLYKKEEIVWKDLSKIFNKKDIKTILSDAEILYKHEIIWKNKNNIVLTISTTLTPIHDEKLEKIISFLLICRDITNHRKIEEEIESKYLKIKEVYKEIWIIKRQSDYIFDLLDMFKNYHWDIKSIGDFIVNSVIMLTQVDGCIFRIYDKKKDCLKMVSNFWLIKDWEWKTIVKFKNSLAEKAYKNNAPLKILDINKEPLYISQTLARKNNFSSVLIIPLQLKWKVLWNISLYTKPDKKLEIFENDFIEKYAKIIELVIGSMEF